MTKVNLIVGTTNNNAPICMSVKKAAQGLIKKGKVNEGLLNMVEMAFRAYDPCFGCATHSLPGQMPLEVRLRDPQGNVLDRLHAVPGLGHAYQPAPGMRRRPPTSPWDGTCGPATMTARDRARP